MHYPLSPVPYSLGTPDGFFTKTNKASMLHFLLDKTTNEVPYPKDAIHIQDGNALFHALSNWPPTCGGICVQVLDQMASKQHFMFSTDTYQADSIKAYIRGCSMVLRSRSLLKGQPPECPLISSRS